MIESKKVEFPGHTGGNLAARLDLPAKPHAFALFAHCFTCTKNSLAAVRIARALAGSGFGVLRFDFTGLGGSEGQFAEGGFSGDVNDLLSAAIDRAIGLKPKGHDFIIDRRHNRPSVSRHMSVTGG